MKSELSKVYSCSVCSIDFTRKGSMTRHNVKHHNATISKKTQSHRQLRFSCVLCNIAFTEKKSLNRDSRNKHGAPKLIKVAPTQAAELTDTQFSLAISQNTKESSENMINSSSERSVFTFNKMEDFYEWKAQIEKDTFSNFVAYTGPQHRLNGDVVRYLNCQRSGQYVPQGTGK